MEDTEMFDEEKYYWNIAQKLLDGYTMDEILLISGLPPQEALVELMMANVIDIDMEDFYFEGDDDEEVSG
jgi:hypothetical protein